MEINIRQTKHAKIVKMTGDINITELDKISEVLGKVRGFSELHLDLSQVTYTSSSFLNVILMVKDKHPDKKILILNPNELVMQLLTLTGIDHLVDIKAGG